MVKAVQEKLIKALVNGGFVSGQYIGEQLGISRTAISKHIKVLTEMGLDIFSVKGKGYKLSQSLNLLDQEKISNALIQLQLELQLKMQSQRGLKNDVQKANISKSNALKDKAPKVEVHSLIDSTNSYLMRCLPNEVTQGQVCLAEFQSAGRGRRGRQWISPFGSQVYLSMYWYLEQGLSAAMGLSLVTALAVSDAIYSLTNIQVQLKWPNDVYLSGVKLAGILIDLEGQAQEPSHSVIGIGLNLNMPEQEAKKIDQQWTDLQSHCSKEIDRNALCAQLIHHLLKRLHQHEKEGLSVMLDEWHAQDFYLNKKVKLLTGKSFIKGICRGVNNQGALMLEVDGQVKPIYGGEVSLRGDE